MGVGKSDTNISGCEIKFITHVVTSKRIPQGEGLGCGLEQNMNEMWVGSGVSIFYCGRGLGPK